jgi:primase-polymerase (primpol)-like protein
MDRHIISAKPKYLAPQFEHIPSGLRSLRQWVVWRAELKRSVVRGELQPGRWSKVPSCVASGRLASSTDPATWADFGDAVAAYNGGGYDGLGFVFSKGGGLVGIDLDHCIKDGKTDETANKLIATLGSYTELSVSGTGLHIITRATAKRGIHRGAVEIYPHSRYFTITGHIYDDMRDLRDNQPVVDWLIEKIAPDTKPQRTPAHKPGRVYLDNDALIHKALDAGNGAKFRRLWEGDTGGYPSASEADLGLLELLLWWSHCDEDRADVLFRQSGLYRPKWERVDYRERCFSFLRGRVDNRDGN